MKISLPVPTVILDDEATIIELLERITSKVDQLDTAKFSDPVKALRHIRNVQARIVMVDIRMPELNGTEVIRACRSFPWHIDFIVISAVGNLKEAQDCYNLGASRIILKPFKIAAVENALQNSLNRILEWNQLVDDCAV